MIICASSIGYSSISLSLDIDLTADTVNFTVIESVPGKYQKYNFDNLAKAHTKYKELLREDKVLFE